MLLLIIISNGYLSFYGKIKEGIFDWWVSEFLLDLARKLEDFSLFEVSFFSWSLVNIL